MLVSPLARMTVYCPTIDVVADVVEGIYSQGQCPHAETLEAAAGSGGLRLL